MTCPVYVPRLAISGLNDIPTYRRIMTLLQQMTFENIVTKGEIAQNEQFLLLPQSFRLFQ